MKPYIRFQMLELATGAKYLVADKFIKFHCFYKSNLYSITFNSEQK